MYYALHCPFLNTVKKFSRLGALNLLNLEADKNFSTFPLFRQKIALSSRSLTAGMVLTFLFWKRCRIRLIRCKESHNSWVAYQLSQNPNFKCPSVKLFRRFIKKSTYRFPTCVLSIRYLKFLPKEIFTFFYQFVLSCT